MLKVESTDQHRKLFAYLNGIRNRDMVAQSVQYAPKSDVRFTPIRPIQFLHQVFEPTVGPLNCGIEYFEASDFHAKWLARYVPPPTFAEETGVYRSFPRNR